MGISVVFQALYPTYGSDDCIGSKRICSALSFQFDSTTVFLSLPFNISRELHNKTKNVSQNSAMIGAQTNQTSVNL